MNVFGFLVCVLLVSVIINESCGSSESDDNDDTINSEADKLDGENLLNMGSQYKMPILRLLGRTLVDHECRYHPCTEWSMWSSCSAGRPNKFGVKSRSRNCNRQLSKCVSTLTGTPEESDYRLCEGACPKAFKVTKHGLCLKFFGTKMSHADAKDSCNSSNAFLVNVNTQDKYDDLTELMKDESNDDHIWIDGSRQDVNSPFEFSYEPLQQRPINWYPYHPINDAKRDCLGESFTSGNKWKVCNWVCNVKTLYVCEVVQQV